MKSARGFTLAELLIVVAIIAVLVAIGIPIFTSQLERSREAVDLSEVRSAYAEVMMAAITGDTTAYYTKDTTQLIYNSEKNVYSITVQPLKQKQEGWQTPLPITIGGVSSNAGETYWKGNPGPAGSCVITYHPPVNGNTEYVSFEWNGGTNEAGGGGSAPGGGSTPGGGEGTGGDGNEGSQPGTGENSSGANNNSSIITDLRKKAIEYPNKAPSDMSFQLIKGNVYIYNGTLYIARDGKSYTNNYDFPKPDNDSGRAQFVIPTTRIITSKEVENDGKATIKGRINEGDIFKVSDSELYVRKYMTDNGQAPPTDLENWVKINY